MLLSVSPVQVSSTLGSGSLIYSAFRLSTLLGGSVRLGTSEGFTKSLAGTLVSALFITSLNRAAGKEPLAGST
ncbi:hypothetical protein D3C81_1961070 [compost metagenome]